MRFDRQASGGTEITLEHRNLERFGDAAAQVRAAVGSPGGWTGLLDAYAKSLA